jgi:hypothetical protein
MFYRQSPDIDFSLAVESKIGTTICGAKALQIELRMMLMKMCVALIGTKKE